MLNLVICFINSIITWKSSFEDIYLRTISVFVDSLPVYIYIYIWQGEVKKKQVADILKSTRINITISANRKVVDFLDLTLDLNTGTYKTFTKPNSNPIYVHKQSNHPPNVLNNIPLAVTRRLTSNSSNKEIFDQIKEPFQKA